MVARMDVSLVEFIPCRRLGSLLLWACVQCVTSIVRAQLLPIVCSFMVVQNSSIFKTARAPKLPNISVKKPSVHTIPPTPKTSMFKSTRAAPKLPSLQTILKKKMMHTIPPNPAHFSLQDDHHQSSLIHNLYRRAGAPFKAHTQRVKNRSIQAPDR